MCLCGSALDLFASYQSTHSTESIIAVIYNQHREPHIETQTHLESIPPIAPFMMVCSSPSAYTNQPAVQQRIKHTHERQPFIQPFFKESGIAPGTRGITLRMLRRGMNGVARGHCASQPSVNDSGKRGRGRGKRTYRSLLKHQRSTPVVPSAPDRAFAVPSLPCPTTRDSGRACPCRRSRTGVGLRFVPPPRGREYHMRILERG